MKEWLITAVMMHGFPVAWGLAAYGLLTWGGRMLENMAVALGWGVLFFSAYRWWQVVRRLAK